MVKVLGQNSNTNTVKQTVETGQKTSGDEGVAGFYAIGGRRQE